MEDKNNNQNIKALSKRVNAINRNIKKHSYLKFLILAVVLIIISLVAYLVQRPQEVRETTAVGDLTRVNYLGHDWYIHGANVPWYNWACDFGCNSNGGVLGNKNTLRAGFQKLKDANMHNARWWVFPGDPWQIERDANENPTGLNPSIYADFDAALELAEEYDLYYNFVLFSDPVSMPDKWLSDPQTRQELAEVLAPLFARYANNPRVMTWEIFNEPEWHVWDDNTNEQELRELIKVITQSVHDNSNSLVTVGSAIMDGIPMMKGLGLDYYSPHWYDYMEAGDWCARCTDYETVKEKYDIDKPVVIGEFYAGGSADSLQRYHDFYNKGFAGAWPWSLFFNRTNDQLQIDFNASTTFSQNKTDIGPRASGLTPQPTQPPSDPTPTDTPDEPTDPNVEPLTELIVDPSSSTVTIDETFTVDIRLDTNGQTINAVDAQLEYPSQTIEVLEIDDSASDFDIDIEQVGENGEIILAYGTNTPLSGDLLIATVTFEANSAGAANVTFSSNSEVTSNISNEDVINTITNGSYTIVVPTPTPVPIPGDMNEDRIVDVQDLSYILSNWRTSDDRADINDDGTVDILDLSTMLSNWTQ